MNQRLFRGVYGTFAEAVHSAPKGRAAGDVLDAHGIPIQSHSFQSLLPSDYPMLYWLSSILAGKSTIFDFGGKVGDSYYSYKPYLSYPVDLKWIVCDLPRVVRAGERLAEEMESAGLIFTDHFDTADGSDILIASGSLQFVETPLADLLSRLTKKPDHLLINKTPLYGGPSFVTLHNALDSTFCPYHIFNSNAFIAALQELGYEVVNQWRVAELSCQIPFHAEREVLSYSGAYFRRRL